MALGLLGIKVVQLSRKDSRGVCVFAVPQTDTGGMVENTKASGRGWFKELGKLTGRKLCEMPSLMQIRAQ